MIYLRDFGWRLGNQLFQLAAAIGLAEENNDRVWFPEWSYANRFCGDFSNPPGLSPSPSRLFMERGHHYTKIPYVPNMVLSGYFQSEKYFAHCADKIRRMFTPDREIMGGGYIRNTCSLHMRLGDYVNLPSHHPVKTYDNYYGKAIEQHQKLTGKNDSLYLVFSDDLDAAKKMLPVDKYSFIFIDAPDEIEAFHTMSLCKDNIIGNSTFSWWAAYINSNPNKTVIAPEEWFGPAYSHLDLKDLIPESWHKV